MSASGKPCGASHPKIKRENKAELAAIIKQDTGVDVDVDSMFDVQVMSPHLATLGCVEIRRSEYLRLVGAAVDQARRFSD